LLKEVKRKILKTYSENILAINFILILLCGSLVGVSRDTVRPATQGWTLIPFTSIAEGSYSKIGHDKGIKYVRSGLKDAHGSSFWWHRDKCRPGIDCSKQSHLSLLFTIFLISVIRENISNKIFTLSLMAMASEDPIALPLEILSQIIYQFVLGIQFRDALKLRLVSSQLPVIS
jgi:hypothetical protein